MFFQTSFFHPGGWGRVLSPGQFSFERVIADPPRPWPVPHTHEQVPSERLFALLADLSVQ